MSKKIISILYLVLVTGCAKDNHTKEVSADERKQTLAPAKSRQLVSVVDVPSLLKMSVTQVKAKLGRPSAELQANATNTERGLVYKKAGGEVTVDYFVPTGQVVDIAIDSGHDTSEYHHLLPLLNVSERDTTYTIEPMPGEKAGSCRGIVVIPKPPVEF